MVKYKVGDRVEYIKREREKLPKGTRGTMLEPDGLGVSWENFNTGHNLKGQIKDNSGWYMNSNDVKLIVDLTKKQRERKIKKIIKEIEGNKDFKESFKDVSKEVHSWEDSKIKRW